MARDQVFSGGDVVVVTAIGVVVVVGSGVPDDVANDGPDATEDASWEHARCLRGMRGVEGDRGRVALGEAASLGVIVL